MSWLSKVCLNYALIGMILGFGLGFLAGILAQYHRFSKDKHTRSNEIDEH